MADGWPYRLVRQLGQGATATVWLAEDLPRARPVALKIGRNEAERQRLADEAERLSGVSSPLLSEVLDAGMVPGGVDRLSAGAPFLALGWHDGAALDSIVDLSNDDRLALAIAIARDISDALADLHAAGTAHGDVKPANVIVARGDAPEKTCARLVDLGLGARLDSSVVGGTPRYLAPESFEPGAAANAKARDLWALGLTLAEVIEPELRTRDLGEDVAERLRASGPLGSVVAALLAKSPAARPGAAWVALRARAILGQSISLEARRQRWQRAVKSSYLSTRRRELVAAAHGSSLEIHLDGIAAEWLYESSDVFRRIGTLRGALATESVERLDDLTGFEQQRWLLKLIGSPAMRFPRLPAQSDSSLAERLLALTEKQDPRAIRFADLLETKRSTSRRAANIEPLALAVELGSAFPSKLAVDRGEDYVQRHAEGAPLRPILAHALQRRGDWAQALVLLDEIGDLEAQTAAAELSRRMGDRAATLSRLDKLEQRPLGELESRVTAIRARLLFDGGDHQGATQLLARSQETASSFELRALLALQRGAQSEALAHANSAAACANDAEQAARAESVLGSIYHSRGDVRAALGAFRNASEHANRAGAIVEEAVYSTNVAAASTDVGEIGAALDAGQRAILLFEHLGRSADAARAMLSVGCAYAVAGANAEASEWLDQTLRRARAAGDRRCEAYAHLALADLTSRDAAALHEHATRAWELLASATSDDRLRAASRLLRWGEVPDPLVYDVIARSPETSTDARFDWWGNRAWIAVRDSSTQASAAVILLTELGKLLHMPAALGSRGPGLARGAMLAMHTGQGETARRFLQAGLECVRQLHEGAPEELRGDVAALPWVSDLRKPANSALLPEQVVDVENLVRSLGARDRLRPLLDQVLDALVLWTGVERGLLLLIAPGGKLVARAARNLARGDIVGEQLHLSESLAQRALATREPVVAVDATGELSELHQSVHNLGLRSVLAVPLLARGEPLGVVYLDDRTRRGAFGPAELDWVRLVGTLAAVAIAEARDQLKLRRSIRRAERAERRVAALLARREVELEVAQRELARTKDRSTRFDYDAIIGHSGVLIEMLELVDRVTASDIPVLITGESGSGKELIARAIHKNGARARRAFVSENCAAIPESLLESTLFGHARGAFTGASQARAGLFEVASGGTLFLDEIGEMSLAMQAKLLRALETGEIRPVGSERVRRVDVRIIAATHRNLEQMVEAGKFRKDLYYRLNVISIAAPPLRERREDIPLLFAHFFAKYAAGTAPELSDAAREALIRYDWPGNVRELENEARRLLVLADDRVQVEDLSPVIRAARAGARPLHDLDLRARVDMLETELLVKALDRTQGNQTRSAELLGISRFGLQKMLKRLNIDVQSLRTGRASGAGLTEAR